MSEIITSGLDKPIIISIGPAGLIKNSIEVGECRFSENLAKLNDKVSGLSKNSDIVLYCGCCPFKDVFHMLEFVVNMKDQKLLNEVKEALADPMFRHTNDFILWLSGWLTTLQSWCGSGGLEKLQLG